jgi:HD-like signal output (HDOD) protein
MAGFLHGVGTLLFALKMPDRYRAAQVASRKRNTPIWKVEREMLGASHTELAAYLLALWQVPPGIANAVAWSHCPDRYLSNTLSPVVIVHVAHHFACVAQSGSESDPNAELDYELLRRLQLTDKVETWRKLCGVSGTDQARAA